SSRRRHTRFSRDWSSDVCSSDLQDPNAEGGYWMSRSPPAFVPRDYLEQAKANLDRCEFIGLTEFYDEDVRALSDLEGHRIYVPRSEERRVGKECRSRRAAWQSRA